MISVSNVHVANVLYCIFMMTISSDPTIPTSNTAQLTFYFMPTLAILLHKRAVI